MEIASYSDYPSFTRRWIDGSKAGRTSGYQYNIVIVRDFEDREPEPSLEITSKEPSFEEILRADFPHAGILSLTPQIEPVANSFATRVVLQAQAKELLATIEHERRERACACEIILAGVGVGLLLVKQALLIADLDYTYIDVRQKISHLGFLGPRDQARGAGSSGPLDMEIALRLDRQFECGNGLTLGHIYNAIAGNDRLFSQLSPKYQTVVSRDADAPWEDTPSKSCGDLWQAFSDALRQAREGQAIDKVPRSQSYCSILSKFSVSHFQHNTRAQPWPMKYPELKSSSTYSAWAKSNAENAILYLHGPSQSGKSSIARSIFAELRNDHERALSVYFSFADFHLPRRSSTTFLRALIFRIISTFPRAFKSIQRHAGWISAKPVLSGNELLIIVRALLSFLNLSMITFVVEDADECKDGILQCLEDLSKLANASRARCKVLVTSSLAPTLSSFWSEFILNIDRNKVSMQMQDVFGRPLHNTGVDSEVIDALKSIKSPTEARVRLKALLASPHSGSSLESARYILERPLHDLYAQLLGPLQGLRSWVVAALSWITYSFRPLSLDELIIAVNLPATRFQASQPIILTPSEIEVELSHALGPLIEFRNGQAYFTDPSVADFARTYLADRANGTQVFSEVHILTHASMTRRCLQYLSQCAADPEASTVESRPLPTSNDRNFEGYAAMYWPYHFNAAAERSILVEDVTEFFASGHACDLWVRRWNAYHNVDPDSEIRSTSLTLAAQHGLWEVVHALLLQDGGEASAPERCTAFETALLFHQLRVARQLSPFTAPSDKALHLMASIGDADLIRDILQEHNNYSDALLSKCVGTAAFHGHLDAIHTLLELLPGTINLPRKDISVFIETVKGGHIDILEYLMKVRGHPLAHDTAVTVLSLAAGAGDREVFNFLLSKGSSLSELEDNGVTCLHSAVASNNIGLVEALIPNIGPNATDSNGNTSLHIACMEGNSEVFDVVIAQNSAKIEHSNEKGERPIHLASQNGHVHMVEQLLKMGASRTVQNGEQFDALHLAVRGGYLDLVKTLLSRSSEGKNADNADGESSVSSYFTEALPDRYAYGSSLFRESSADSSEEEDEDQNEDRKEQIEKEADDSARSEVETEETSDEEQETDEEESTDSDITVREHDTEPSPMHSAAKRGYVDIMRELLNVRFDYTMANRLGATPLHLAAAGGHRAATKLLLEIERNLNASDIHGCLPIHRACESGNSLVLNHLIEAGSSTDVPDTSGRVPLHICAEHGHDDSLQLLLGTGIDVNSSNYYSGETALHISARSGHASIINILTRCGGNTELRDRQKRTALHLSLLEGHAETSMALLNAGADLSVVNARGQTPLFCAVSGGMDSHVISKILATQVNVPAFVRKYPNLISEAVSAGCGQDVVKLLMEAGWSPFAKQNGKSSLNVALGLKKFPIAMQFLRPTDDESPPIDEYSKALVEITLAGFVEGIRQVLEYPGVNLETRGGPYNQTPLAVAAESGMIEIVELLLDRHADFNAKDRDGYTPVMLALGNGHLEATSLLFDHGADVGATSNRGITTLEFAIRSRRTDIVDLVLQRGAAVTPGLLAKCVSDRDLVMVETLLSHNCNPLQPDSKGRTAIHAALEAGDAALLETLVSYGMSKLGGEQGWTPLHLAAMVGQVDPLLAHNDHIQVADHKGRTALHWAASRGHVDAVRTLSDLHADLAAQDEQGKTALHLAAANGHDGVVRSLIEKNSPWDILDQFQWKAVHYANARGHEEIVTLLKDSYHEVVPGSGSPNGWDRKSQPTGLLVMNDGRNVMIDSAVGENLSKEVHMRTKYPITPKKGVLYYEVEIRKSSKERKMGLGICTESSPHESIPGCNVGAVGYHANDGCLFEPTGRGKTFGPQYSTGDTVGCGFDFHQQWVFFTNNGSLIWKRKWETQEMLYPVLGFGENGSEITTNFGQEGFRYKGFDDFAWREDS